MIRFFILIAIMLARQAYGLIRRGISFDGNMAMARADDEGLAAAKSQAVSTLPEFLRRLSSPGIERSTIAVKAPIAVDGGSEHVWLSNIRVEGDAFVGTIDNNPHPRTGKRAGDTLRVARSEISDWRLVENGVLVGGYTIRYFMSRMPAKQRAVMLASFKFRIEDDPIRPAPRVTPAPTSSPARAPAPNPRQSSFVPDPSSPA
jgi:uncharacterized protein YegJ (DUF2314 family)